ncbi:hypothetical protein ESA94_12285 [Lacibacter luteus]|uniref:Glycosyltransferase RgtA/B/C/D-like domain-containing protein n=1 Tax=Lacibacter luteus TaxID=2508719 RepID=A0A4Q1CHL5_9BACT|nr:hypothetical protein [Lacibacter luteus]RXK59827.1 hypothetical protein ESA94_12285 [Lacibacter luteus]
MKRIKQHFNPWAIASIIVCGLLFLLQLFFIERSQWTGDYWEHNAVIKELSLHLQQPGHPILNVDVPHAFFSPYSVFLGAIISLTGIQVSTLLNLAMIANLLLFFSAVYLLATMFISEKKDHAKAFLLLLILTLFFWGSQAPLYSSFFHFSSFTLTLSYPSTFAFICSVYAAAVSKQLLIVSSSVRKELALTVVLSCLLFIIGLTHPLTVLFTGSLILCVYLSILQQQKFNQQFIFKKTTYLVGAGALALTLAGFWPYYPFFSLITYAESGNQFHSDSLVLYQHIAWKIFPVFLLPVLVLFTQSLNWKKEWPLYVSLLLLLLIYAVGFYTKSYGLGRMLAFAVIVIHLLLVKNLLLIRKAKAIWFTLIFILTLPYLFQTKNIFRSLNNERRQIASDSTSFQQAGHSAKADALSFLEPILEKRSSIVLTDLQTGLFIPALGGKVVAAVYPVYWVNDADQRKEQVTLFFSNKASQQDRLNTIYQHRPDYILLTPSTSYLFPRLAAFIESDPVAVKQGISLYQVKTYH